MVDNSYDAIVVGGGPGGSTTAAFLGKSGKKVLILEKEKWPRDKTCGDAISGKSVGIVHELGITEEIEKADHGEVYGLTFSSPEGRQVTIPFGGKERNISKGYVCRRMVYDNLLWKNAKNYAEAIEGAAVTGVIREDGRIAGVKAKLGGGETKEFRARIVVGADGVSSLIAREIRGGGIDPAHTCIAYRGYYSGIANMNSTLEIHFVRSIMPGYFWIFPTENGLANVGVGMLMSDMKEKNVNLQNAMLDIVKNNPLFKERFRNANLVSKIGAWSLPFGSKQRKVCTDDVLLVGDAAGLVDPFSGEGVGNAMLSGRLAAKVAGEALDMGDTSGAFLERYEKRLWAEVGGELSRSFKMQQLGRNEWLLNFVINKAATSERARDAIAETFSNREAEKYYASPFFYLKLLLS